MTGAAVFPTFVRRMAGAARGEDTPLSGDAAAVREGLHHPGLLPFLRSSWPDPCSHIDLSRVQAAAASRRPLSCMVRVIRENGSAAPDLQENPKTATGRPTQYGPNRSPVAPSGETGRDAPGQPGMPKLTQGAIGSIVDPAFAGRGFASDLARGLRAAAFEDLGLRRVTAGCNAETLPPHACSRRRGCAASSTGSRTPGMPPWAG